MASRKACAEYSSKLETRSLIDSIIKPACRANHRHRTITQAIHLIQAAGLVLAGHQKHIRARLDFVRQGFIVSEADADAVRMRRRRRPQSVFVVRVPRPEYHQVQVLSASLVRDSPQSTPCPSAA